jgi:hypothetical protein
LLTRQERRRLSRIAWQKSRILMLEAYRPGPGVPPPGSPAWLALEERLARHIMWYQLQGYGKPQAPLPNPLVIDVPEAAFEHFQEMLREEAAKLN